MHRFLCAFALAVLALTAVAKDRQSFVFNLNGQTITNGVPVNNKAIRARYGADFFWFTRDGREYVVRDKATLRRIREVYNPIFDPASFAGLALLGEQMEVMREQLRIGVEPQPGEAPSAAARRLQLKMRQNELARQANDAARHMRANPVEKINEAIERELEALSAELARSH